MAKDINMANTCSKPAATPITHTHANCPFHEYLIVISIKSQVLSNYGGVVVLEIGLRFETDFWRSRSSLEIDWIFTRCCLVLSRFFLIIFKTSQDHSCRDMNVLNIFLDILHLMKVCTGKQGRIAQVS